MKTRRCTCGAEVHVLRRTRRTADGREDVFFQVNCPVCGQSGPEIAAAGKDEATATAEAIAAWNRMIARLRPFEA